MFENHEKKESTPVERKVLEKLGSAEIGPNKRKELVDGLREKGIEDAEVQKALIAWTEEREKIVEAFGRTPEAQVGFEIDRANIYREGNYMDAAFDTLYDALHIAQQENEPELEARVRKEIAQMDGAE